MVLLSVPALAPIARWRTLSMALRLSIIAFTVGMVLQLVFVVLVATGILTLDYSSRFGAVGLPCSIIALAGGAAGGVRARPALGVITGSILAAGMWVFLETLH